MKFQVLVPLAYLLSALDAASPADYYGGYNPCRPKTITSTKVITSTGTKVITVQPPYCTKTRTTKTTTTKTSTTGTSTTGTSTTGTSTTGTSTTGT
ncbi:hypothetical protein K502DRAFT_352916, partial [Neoconidiobolus thromboides FSU 785]